MQSSTPWALPGCATSPRGRTRTGHAVHVESLRLLQRRSQTASSPPDVVRRGMTGPSEIFEGPKGLIHQLGIPGVAEVTLRQRG